MVVGAARDEIEAARREPLGERLRVVDDRLGVDLERRARRLVRRDGDGGGGVVVRPALQAGEHGLVDGRGQRLLAHHDAAARPAQRLVRRRRHHVGDAGGRGVDAGDDEPRDVRDVGGEHGADLAGDLAERGEVDGARVGRGAAEDELGAVLLGERAHLVEVDARVGRAQAVGHALEVFARDGDGVAVREVPARREPEPHDGVARREQREVDREVGRAARVGLHVDVLHAEQRRHARAGELLDGVDRLLTLVVALARVPLGVLVGEHRGARLEHGARHVVLARDDAQGVGLAALLLVDEAGDLGVDFGEGGLVPGAGGGGRHGRGA